MKKRNIILISIMIILLSFFCVFLNKNKVAAKEVETNDFSISIGDEDDIWPNLVSNKDGTYKLNFSMSVKGKKEETGPKFSITNEMYYYVDGTKYQEIDILNEEDMFFEVNEEYGLNIYDDDMPSYYEGFEPIDKVYFQLTFSCINCGQGEEYEGYEYTSQVTPIIELNVKYDNTAPVLCANANDCSYPTSGEYINDYEFKFTATDDKSGIKYIKYVFTTSMTITFDDLVNDITDGTTFYYLPEREDLINMVDVESEFYLFVVAEDYAGNYSSMDFYYRYLWEKVDNNLVYDNETSIIPDQSGFYKNINIKIDAVGDLYYSWSNYPYAEANLIKQNGSVYDKETGIDYTYNYTRTRYLIVVSFTSDNDFTFMILSYNFDNSAPMIKTSSYPEMNKTYKNVTLNFGFEDNSGSYKNAFYLITETKLDSLSGVNNLYVGGTDITLGDNLNGDYYIYFAVYDNLDNVYGFYLTYTFDNLAPSLSLSISEQEALKVSNGKSIKLTVVGLKGTTFKCKWALSNVSLTASDLDSTCTNNGTIDAPNNSEGYYKLWAYLEDEVGNSNLYTSYPFLVDSKGPNVSITSAFEDETYRETNQIEVVVTDNFSEVTSIYYKWYQYDYNVTSGNSFVNQDMTKISYPDNSYGVYALWVYAIDEAGNGSLYKNPTRYYVDTEKYSLTLVGSETIKIVQKEKYIDPGVKALKGQREMSYEVISNLNPKKAGTYTITYKLNDLEVTRKVIVSKTTHYYLIIGLSLVLGIGISLIPHKKKNSK